MEFAFKSLQRAFYYIHGTWANKNLFKIDPAKDIFCIYDGVEDSSNDHCK